MNNNCATGSSALFMANQLVAGGMADCVLALGFEKMQRGSLTSQVIMNIIRFLLLAVAHLRSINCELGILSSMLVFCMIRQAWARSSYRGLRDNAPRQ